MPDLDIGELAGARRFGPIVDPAPIAYGPAGKGPGDFVDVIVDIADGQALHSTRDIRPMRIAVVQIVASPQGVQFQQFTRKVYIRGRGPAFVVVQVVEH